MRKQEFLFELRKGLKKLPRHEIEECISFYSELIDDRIESGISEEEAVKMLGNPQKIASERLASQISDELMKSGNAKKPTEKKRDGKALRMTLLILVSPVLFSLLIALFSVALSLFVSAWAVVGSLWVACFALAVSAPVGAIFGIYFMFMGMALPGTVMLSMALVALGLAIFAFFAGLYLTKGCTYTTKKLFSHFR